MMMPREKGLGESEVVGSKCDFCDGHTINCQCIYSGTVTMKNRMRYMFGKVVDSSKEDGIWMEDGNYLAYDSSSGEYAPQGIRINYCPFCGKQLLGDDNGKQEVF